MKIAGTPIRDIVDDGLVALALTVWSALILLAILH